MPNMTISLPEDVYQIIKRHKEVRWSEIARSAIEEYAKKNELLNTMTADSELTIDEIMVLDTMVKEGIHQHYKIKASQKNSRISDSF